MRRISRENSKIYRSNASAILHTDVTNPDYIARVTTFPEIKSTYWLTEAIFIVDVIIIKVYLVGLFPDKSSGNNITTGEI